MSRPPSKRKRAEENPDNDSDDEEQDAGGEESLGKEASAATPAAKRTAYSSDEAQQRPGEEGGETQKFRKWISFIFSASLSSFLRARMLRHCAVVVGRYQTGFVLGAILLRRCFACFAISQRIFSLSLSSFCATAQ
jgi:hypothetical protein